MKSNIRFFVLLFLLCLAALACKAASFGNSEPEPGDILFKDDFSDPSSGWKRITEDSGQTDYANGVYRVRVNRPNMDVWSNPGLNFTDVQVEVQGTKVGGPDDNDFGIICRSVDTNNFYFFIISSDGYYAIGKVKDGVQQLLSSDAMQPSEAIEQGATPNHIRADCIGSYLALHVNDEKLAEVQDQDFQFGDVGLIAGAFDQPGVEILFDDFLVLKP